MDIQEIKKYMRDNNITYEELSKKSNLSISTIKKVLAGISRYPRIDTMQAIERALGIDNDKNPPDRELSEGEAELLELFNRVPEDKKELVLQMIQTAVKNL